MTFLTFDDYSRILCQFFPEFQTDSTPRQVTISKNGVYGIHNWLARWTGAHPFYCEKDTQVRLFLSHPGVICFV